MTAARAAFCYSGLLCLAYALLPSLTFPNPPLDVVEGFAWGREMQLGYTKHPPMQAWLLEASYLLTGGSGYGAYWLSSLCAGIGYGFIWGIARQLGLRPWQGFWAIVLTSVTFYFTLPLPEFNPNILQIPVWAGMIFFLLRALSKGTLLDWLLLGALAAFGFYTKYFVVLLIGAIGLYILIFADARRQLARPGPWLCALVFLTLISPHVAWLLETDFLTFRYALGRSNPAGSLFDHVYNPVNFLLAQIANHAGLLLVIAAGLSWTTVTAPRPALAAATANFPDTMTPQADRLLLWFAFLPLAVVLLISAMTGSEFKHMWGTPLFVLSGLVAVRYLHLPDLWTVPKRSLGTAIAIHLIFLGVLFGQAMLEPFWKTKHSRIHFPGKAVAETLAREWADETGTELAYVAGDMWMAANITLHAPSRPSMFLDHDAELSPWIDLTDVQKKGVMIVWQGDSLQPGGHIQSVYPDALRQGTAALPFHSYGSFPDLKINWMIIPPGKVATPAN